MRVLQNTAALEVGNRWLTLLEPARTRVMLLVALAAAAAVFATGFYPPAQAALFCLLLGAACTLPLRLNAAQALVTGPAAVLVLTAVRLLASATGADSGTGVSAWAGAAMGDLLLLGCSLAALWTSEALARPSGADADRRRPYPGSGEAAILRREDGRERLEWELARATDYRRPLTLCLLGLDREPADPAGPAARMRRVDHLLTRELGRFESAAELGPGERLLILPEVWADGYADTAVQLCARAAGRVGRTVRAALITFPFDGRGRDALIARLELALESCRAGGALVSVGASARPVCDVEDFAS